MVSSTFYDLRQIRDDLRQFIEGLGYRPLLSEHPSFPIDPDATTIENCRRRVEQDADVLVLVIGGRYGSIDATPNKSVTNLEYTSARHKRIPIYVFIDPQVLALLPLWKRNQAADFSEQVDSPRLFEFIEHVRTIDAVWMNEFRIACDITDALRTQFAYQQQAGTCKSPMLIRNRMVAVPPIWATAPTSCSWPSTLASTTRVYSVSPVGRSFCVAMTPVRSLDSCCFGLSIRFTFHLGGAPLRRR